MDRPIRLFKSLSFSFCLFYSESVSSNWTIVVLQFTSSHFLCDSFHLLFSIFCCCWCCYCCRNHHSVLSDCVIVIERIHNEINNPLKAHNFLVLRSDGDFIGIIVVNSLFDQKISLNGENNCYFMKFGSVLKMRKAWKKVGFPWKLQKLRNSIHWCCDSDAIEIQSGACSWNRWKSSIYDVRNSSGLQFSENTRNLHKKIQFFFSIILPIFKIFSTRKFR